MNTGGLRQPMSKGVGRVRPPKKHSELNVDTVERLGQAIKRIQNHQVSQLSFEEHYRYAYNLVLHKKGHVLYNMVAELVSEHLEAEAHNFIVPVFPPSTASSLLASGSGPSSNRNVGSSNLTSANAGQLFLERLSQVWEDHLACMSKLRDLLKYMDRNYLTSTALPSTWDLGLSLFFHHVILFSTNPKTKASSSKSQINATPTKLPTADPATIAYHLVSTLLSVIRIEREGEAVSRSAIRNSIDILCRLTDEGPLPLPITSSAGTGSGSPVLGYSTTAGAGRWKPVMGEGSIGDNKSPYKTSFESIFLKQTAEFYEKESAVLLIECDAPSYLEKIAKRLEEEATRAQSYLSASTEPLLISLLEKTLITNHLHAILNHSAMGLSALIQDSRIQDLHRLYTLFGRVPDGHAALQAGISTWIITVGKSVNEGLVNASGEVAEEVDDASVDVKGKGKAFDPETNPKPKPIDSGAAKTKAALHWVQNVLDLKDKFDQLLTEAFDRDKAFAKSFDDAFSEFVNANAKSPEYISLFVDENLKKSLKGKTEAEVDDVLNRTIALFRFLVEKDQFERYYNSHLAKRLISQRSVSDDAERNMLAKFKIEAGAAFTKSAEGMMKDIKISEDTLVEYKRYQERAAIKAPFEMATIVCGQNFWPFTSKEQACVMPQILLKGIELFTGFYDIKHSGRKLTFKPELGNVEVKARFKTRSHELNVSTHAMVVLILFEGLHDDEALVYTDIAAATRMAPAELKRTLQSLACAKFKILLKSPKGRDVNEKDRFVYNSGFVCNLAKIKIQTVASKVESADERKDTEEKVEDLRNTQCEACIVRVMKDRKSLPLVDLVNEVIKQLSSRFKPHPTMIKQAIERLIDKEYLERDEMDRRRLRYVA